MKKAFAFVLLAIAALAVAFSLYMGSTAGTGQTDSPSVPAARTVAVEILSDPEDASLVVDGRPSGRTPVTVEVEAGTSHTYRLSAPEPYADYRLYKTYSGTFVADEDMAISVWIDRTTATEQAAQREAAAADRAREAEARARAEQERCRERIAQAAVIIEDWHWGRTAGGAYVEAEGRVTNNSGSTLRNIQALVEYETADGQFITSDYGTIELRDLLPRQSSPFSVLTPYNPAMSRARLRIREFFGSVIPTITRDNASC